MLALLLVAVLSYWPGGDGQYASSPTYDRRVPVIDTLGVRDRAAVREWNRCGAVRLVRGGDLEPYTPGAITIVAGETGDLPRGGWAGTYGIVLLPPGSWERSLPVIRHELGHALGFGHTKRWSIMGGSSHVRALDCEGLRSYYS
jgi:hypothetical protein